MSIQEKINSLLWDRQFIVLPKDLDGPEDLDYIILRDPTLSERNYYVFLRKLEEQKALQEGVLSEQELLKQARSAGYWTEEDDKVEKEIDNHIEFLKSEFENKKKFKARQHIIQWQIDEAQAKKEYIKNKHTGLRLQSAEYLAHEIASFDLLRKLVYKPDNSLLINGDADLAYFKQNYILLLYFIIHAIMNDGSYPIKDIRAVARSMEWRLIWTLAKENLSSLFNRPICDLNLNHKILIYWSRIYDMAFETPEPPETSVIEDDIAFDQWLANKDLQKKEDKTISKHANERCQVLDGTYVEECTCGAKQANVGKYLGEKIPHQSTCLFGRWRAYSQEEKEKLASNIYGRNQKKIRELINNEQNHISNKGLIQEQHLRQNQKTRQLLGMPTKIIPIGKR